MIGFQSLVPELPNGGLQLSTISQQWLVQVSSAFPLPCQIWGVYSFWWKSGLN